MSEAINEKVKSKISEDLSPTKNLTGLHLKIVAAIAIIWSLFQLWYASPFPFWFNIGMFKGLPARAIHLGFALTLAFLIYPTIKGKKISILDKWILHLASRNAHNIESLEISQPTIVLLGEASVDGVTKA